MIKIYPNPVKSQLFIANSGTAGYYNIYDFSGKLVKSGALDTRSSETPVSVSGLSPGLYAVNVMGESFVIVIAR